MSGYGPETMSSTLSDSQYESSSSSSFSDQKGDGYDLETQSTTSEKTSSFDMSSSEQVGPSLDAQKSFRDADESNNDQGYNLESVSSSLSREKNDGYGPETESSSEAGDGYGPETESSSEAGDGYGPETESSSFDGTSKNYGYGMEVCSSTESAQSSSSKNDGYGPETEESDSYSENSTDTTRVDFVDLHVQVSQKKDIDWKKELKEIYNSDDKLKNLEKFYQKVTKESGLVYDWNEEFQQILQLPDGLDKFERLATLYRDFVYASKTFGRIIISEKYLPDSRKTIAPIDAGGRAGGVKYAAQGILFKFQIDTQSPESGYWMYGLSERADHEAAKAGSHELKGLINILNTRDNATLLNYPLMALIDYRGFRLIAISWLSPLHKHSLVYGSDDGGATVYAEIPELNEQMEIAGKMLNLEPHLVGTCEGKSIAFCGDIEGHIGTDGRYYVLDFARVFPPDMLPTRERKSLQMVMGHEGKLVYKRNYPLFHLLRPELVETNEIPLNPDCRSPGFSFDEIERKEGRKQIVLATRRLFQDVIPSYAEDLSQIAPVILMEEDYKLTDEIHRYGINCRHLGRIRKELANLKCYKEKFQSAFVLIEITARAAKGELRHLCRETMRSRKIPCSEPYIEVTVQFFNKLFSNSNDYWCCPITGIKSRIEEYFPYSLFDEELDPTYDLRDSLGFDSIFQFFKRLQKLTKVKIAGHINRKIERMKSNIGGIKLLKVDVRSMSAKIKHLDFMDFCEAKMLYQQAIEQPNVEQSVELLSIADRKFSSANASNTNSWGVLFWWARSLYLLSNYDSDPKSCKRTLERAASKIRRCFFLCSDPNVELYLTRVRILVKLGTLQARTTFEEHFKHITEAYECLFEFQTNNDEFEPVLFEEVTELYNTLGLVPTLSSSVRRIFENKFDVSIDRYRELDISQDEIVLILSHLSKVYHWHQLYLRFRNSGVVRCQAADILMRWGLWLSNNDRDLQLYLQRAGQQLEIALLTSTLDFNLLTENESEIDGPINVTVERLTVEAKQRLINSKNFLSGSHSLSSIIFPDSNPEESDSGSFGGISSNSMQGYLYLKLTTRFRNKWKKKWCRFSHGRFSYQDKRSKKEVVNENSFIVCSTGKKPDEGETRNHCFSTDSATKSYVWSANTPEELSAWLKHIENDNKIDRTDEQRTLKAKRGKSVTKSRRAIIINSPSVSSKMLKSSDVQVLDGTSEEIVDYSLKFEYHKHRRESNQVSLPNTRILIPTLVTCWLESVGYFQPESIFCSDENLLNCNNKTLNVHFNFDFVPTCVSRVDFHVGKEQSQGESIKLGFVCIWICNRYPMDEEIENFLNADTPEEAENLSLIGIQLTMEMKSTRLQKWNIGPYKGLHYFLKIIPQPSVSIQLIQFHGVLCPTDLPVYPEPQDEILQSFGKARQVSLSESGMSSDDTPPAADKAIVNLFQTFYQGSSWVATLFRITENSPILTQLLHSVIEKTTAKKKKSKVRYDYENFLKRHKKYCLPLDYEYGVRKTNFERLSLSSCSLINQYVLHDFTTYCTCYHIDLSDTHVTTFDIFALVQTCGNQLTELLLKGCHLGVSTISHIASYCPKLRYLGMWDCDSAVLEDLTRALVKTKINFLDLSSLNDVSNAALENLRGVSFMDLSYANGSYDSRGLKKFLNNNCDSLEILILRRYAIDDQNLQPKLEESAICDLISNLHEIKYMDLSYNAISDDTLNVLSSNCTGLSSLIMDGCDSFSEVFELSYSF
eukprot:TRINITY_DN2221_c0_g1_i2.p1 TRINITY_DN2221_c0_g1~~TRINITY_DN2221_c0_g1_i2.p1  ORF type:complete len:1736 (-),score=335.94 TRINITY_DN2221_c0_g1_i2:57-5264(-)